MLKPFVDRVRGEKLLGHWGALEGDVGPQRGFFLPFDEVRTSAQRKWSNGS